MPIAIICGSCEAKLNAPDAAAGKRVKCPKCGVLLEIPKPEPEPSPDFEVIEDAPTMMMPPIKKGSVPPLPPKPAAAAKAPPPAAKPKSKPVLLEEDDEDDAPPPPPKKKSKPAVDLDDDEDDRPALKKKPASKPAVVLDDEDDEDDRPKPKKKGKKKPAAKSNTMLFAVIGGVVGVGLIGFLVYWFAIREPEVAKGPSGGGGPGSPAAPAGPPPGWQQFNKPEFSALVRSTAPPQEQNTPVAPGIRSGKVFAFQTQNPNGVHAITLITLDELGAAAAKQDPNSFLDAIFSGGAAKSKGALSGRTNSQLDGKPARDAQLQNGTLTMYLRGAVDGNRVYFLMAGGDGVANAQNEHVKMFFEGFKIGGEGGTGPGPGRPAPTKPGAGASAD